MSQLQPVRVTIIEEDSGDWGAVYLDGRRVTTGHMTDFTPVELLSLLGIAFEHIRADNHGASYHTYPQELSEGERAPGEESREYEDGTYRLGTWTETTKEEPSSEEAPPSVSRGMWTDNLGEASL